MNYVRIAAHDLVIVHANEMHLHAANAWMLREQLMKLIERGERRIILDLGQLTFIDSSGIGALAAVLKQIGPCGALVLTGLARRVEKAFQTTRMDQVFTITSNIDAAIAHLQNRDIREAA